MNTTGFFISEIRLTGKDKKDARLILKKGLNVISGASDTGKTYIFQLINYMFGGKEEPKDINESIGYSTIFLELESYRGEQYTLRRNIGDSSIYAYYTKIDDMSVLQQSTKLKSKHDKKDKDNISTFLLSLTGMENLFLRQNDRGTKVAFSFRQLVSLIMLDEEKIISENLPIFSGIPTSKTTEQSAFKTILTGVDDSQAQEIEDPKIYKTRLEGKLEFVNALLQKLRVESKKQISKIREYSISDLESELEELKVKMSNNSIEINMQMERKKELWDQEQIVKSRILMLEELLERFSLLEKSYLSDLDRLQFLIEGDHYISQLFDSNCPICDNSFSLSTVENNHSFHLEDLQLGCAEESNKIKAQLIDLRETYTVLENENKENNKKLIFLSQQIKEIEIIIQDQLNPAMVITKEKIDELIELKKLSQEVEYNKSRISEYEKDYSDILADLSKKNQKLKFTNEITSDLYDDLAVEIKKILEAWNYPDLTNVIIDYKDQEIIVSNKKRKSHGKGYRAILNTAFVIAIMKYTRKNKLKHPGLIIVDSPLTTYKEKLNEEVGNEEDISLNMKQAFFEDLSQIEKDTQLIVFENIDPIKQVQKNMNYIHFSKINGVGRYGFIPVDDFSEMIETK